MSIGQRAQFWRDLDALSYYGHMTEHPPVGPIPPWTLQDRLRKAREYAGLEQGQLGELIGLKRTTVGNYERGVTEPRWPVLLAWALACQVDLDWLAGTDPNCTSAMPKPPRDRALYLAH